MSFFFPLDLSLYGGPIASRKVEHFVSSLENCHGDNQTEKDTQCPWGDNKKEKDTNMNPLRQGFLSTLSSRQNQRQVSILLRRAS